MEFNRFLDYYSDSKDLNAKADPRARDKVGRDRKKSRNIDGETQRFFVNKGRMDNLNPGALVRVICAETDLSSAKIGEIEIMREFSFFEVAKDVADTVLDKMQGAQFDGRDVNVELAGPKKGGNRSKQRRGGPRNDRRGGGGNRRGGGGGGHKKVLTSTNRGCLYRICLDVELYLVGLSKGNGSEDGEVDAVEASTCPIRTWAEKHKVRWQSFVIGTLRGVEERQERHLAGLPIPCPDGINIIYDAGPQSNSNASDFGLSNSMRGKF